VYVTGDVTSDDIVRLNEGRMQQAEEGDNDSSRLALPNASV
jgi:amidophosphoribosyltransferase